LYAVSPADVVFGYGRFVWMLQANVPVVLHDPGFNAMASMPSVNLTTFAGYTIHAWSFESQVILHRPKEASNLPQWEDHRLHFVPGQQLPDATEGNVDKWKDGDRDGLLQGWATKSAGHLMHST
jgi:hypothetical protein